METRRPRVLATICARGGSKGVPGKNLRSLLGKPLIACAIECARACPTVDRIVVSIDSDKSAAVAESCGAPVPSRRPSELASDASPKITAIRHAVTYLAEKEGYEADIIVALHVGVPLRRPEDITACVVTQGKPRPGCCGARVRRGAESVLQHGRDSGRPRTPGLRMPRLRSRVGRTLRTCMVSVHRFLPGGEATCRRRTSTRAAGEPVLFRESKRLTLMTRWIFSSSRLS